MIIVGTEIEIPDSLIIVGHLYLRGSKVTELPAGLIVGGHLYLKKSNESSLPDCIQVGGRLYAGDGQLIASEELQLYPIAGIPLSNL